MPDPMDVFVKTKLGTDKYFKGVQDVTKAAGGYTSQLFEGAQLGFISENELGGAMRLSMEQHVKEQRDVVAGQRAYQKLVNEMAKSSWPFNTMSWAKIRHPLLWHKAKKYMRIKMIQEMRNKEYDDYKKYKEIKDMEERAEQSFKMGMKVRELSQKYFGEKGMAPEEAALWSQALGLTEFGQYAQTFANNRDRAQGQTQSQDQSQSEQQQNLLNMLSGAQSGRTPGGLSMPDIGSMATSGQFSQFTPGWGSNGGSGMNMTNPAMFSQMMNMWGSPTVTLGSMPPAMQMGMNFDFAQSMGGQRNMFQDMMSAYFMVNAIQRMGGRQLAQRGYRRLSEQELEDFDDLEPDALTQVRDSIRKRAQGVQSKQPPKPGVEKPGLNEGPKTAVIKSVSPSSTPTVVKDVPQTLAVVERPDPAKFDLKTPKGRSDYNAQAKAYNEYIGKLSGSSKPSPVQYARVLETSDGHVMVDSPDTLKREPKGSRQTHPHEWAKYDESVLAWLDKNPTMRDKITAPVIPGAVPTSPEEHFAVRQQVGFYNKVHEKTPAKKITLPSPDYDNPLVEPKPSNEEIFLSQKELDEYKLKVSAWGARNAQDPTEMSKFGLEDKQVFKPLSEIPDAFFGTGDLRPKRETLKIEDGLISYQDLAGKTHHIALDSESYKKRSLKMSTGSPSSRVVTVNSLTGYEVQLDSEGRQMPVTNAQREVHWGMGGTVFELDNKDNPTKVKVAPPDKQMEKPKLYIMSDDYLRLLKTGKLDKDIRERYDVVTPEEIGKMVQEKEKSDPGYVRTAREEMEKLVEKTKNEPKPLRMPSKEEYVVMRMVKDNLLPGRRYDVLGLPMANDVNGAIGAIPIVDEDRSFIDPITKQPVIVSEKRPNVRLAPSGMRRVIRKDNPYDKVTELVSTLYGDEIFTEAQLKGYNQNNIKVVKTDHEAHYVDGLEEARDLTIKSILPDDPQRIRKIAEHQRKFGDDIDAMSKKRDNANQEARSYWDKVLKEDRKKRKKREHTL